jgi:hypothetical protein
VLGGGDAAPAACGVPPDERDQTNAIDPDMEETIMTQHRRRWGCASLFVLVGWLLVSLLYLLSVPVYALERLVPYDDFNAAHIDPDKWFGFESAGPGTEAIRQLQDQRLSLVYRSYGKTDSDSGNPRNDSFLALRNSAAVTALQATVQVNDAAATGCSSNPEATLATAGLLGFFFNTATPTPGSSENGVVAFIGIARASDAKDPPDVFGAVSIVFHCTNADCTAGSELHVKELGPVKRGEMARLRVQWERNNHQFIFQRDDNPEVVAPYTVSDTAPPGAQFKALYTMHLVPNCTVTPRPVAFIEALFDDVMVNESAASRAGR